MILMLPPPTTSSSPSRRWDRAPLILASAVLFFGWTGFVVSDVLNLAGVRESVVAPVTGRALFFMWFFDEGATVEITQWILLGVAILAATNLAKKAYRAGDRGQYHTFLLGIVGLGLMYMEDTMNLRHLLSFHVTMPLFYEGNLVKNHVRTVTELSFYAILGATMVGFLWRSWPRFRRTAGAHRWLVTGYGCYALAAVASATRYVGDWYERAGAALSVVLAPGAEHVRVTMAREDLILVGYDVGFFLMDWMLEESVELIGAAALAAALLRVATRRAPSDLGEAAPAA